MNRLLFLTFFWTVSFLAGCSIPKHIDTTVEKTYSSSHVETNIISELDIANPALYFATQGNTAAVLVHDYVSTRKNWLPFAKRLQQLNIATVAIENISRRDVLDAIRFLKQRRYQRIILIGASMGGGSAIQAANQHPDWVDRIVLISTTDPGGLQDDDLKKLFIIAKKDSFAFRAYSAYESSVDPKVLKEYTGYSHGQAMLSSEHGERIHKDIIDFIVD